MDQIDRDALLAFGRLDVPIVLTSRQLSAICMSRSGWLAEQKSDSARFSCRRHAAMEREDGPEEHGCGPDREGPQEGSSADKASGKEGQAAAGIESQESDRTDADEARQAAQGGC